MTIIFNNKSISLLDLTHPLTPATPSWNGSAGFAIDTKLDYQDSDSEIKFKVQQIKMHAGIGTHMDAPAHCVPGGATIDNIRLEQLYFPCVKIDVSNKADASYSLSVTDIEHFVESYGQCLAGALVVVYTGWDKHWHTPLQYCNNHMFPSISKAAAELLLMNDIAGIGIDTLSPDRPTDGFLVHQLLLGQGKIIIENIANAALLPVLGSHVLAMPLKMQGATEAPIRLLAII